MKMDFNINEIGNNRKYVVKPLSGGGFEISNRADHNLDIIDSQSSAGFWIIAIVLFLVFWRIAIGNSTSTDETTTQQVRTEKMNKRPVNRI